LGNVVSVDVTDLLDPPIDLIDLILSPSIAAIIDWQMEPLSTQTAVKIEQGR